MAKFCGKCGSPLDMAFGLCPVCDAEALAQRKAAPKFCTTCGSVMDVNGTCPVCSAAAAAQPVEAVAVEQPVEQPVEAEAPSVSAPSFCTVCGGWLDPSTGICPACEMNRQAEQPVSLAAVATEEPPATIAVPEAPAKKKLGMWFPILMAILLFITSLPVVAIYTVRNITTEEGISALLEEVPVFALVEDSITEADKDDFCRALGKYLHIEMSFDQVEDFLEKADINELVAEKVAAFANDLYTGENTFSLSSDDAYDLLNKNSRVIEKEFGVSLDRQQMEDIAVWMIDDDTAEDIGADMLKESAPGLYSGIQLGLSYVTLVIFAALSVLVIVAMFLNNVSRAACGVGVSMTVLGGLFVLPAVIAGLLPALWESLFGGLIGMIVGTILFEALAVYVVVLLVGILLLVGRTVVLWLMKRKQAAVLN